MDRVGDIRIFTHVVRTRSYTHAAVNLGLAASTVRIAVKRLEMQVGAHLLQRKSHPLLPTAEGKTYYHRCVDVLTDLDRAEVAVTGSRLAGPIRATVPDAFACRFIVPGLPAFVARYPEIVFELSPAARDVEVARGTIDCIIRVGKTDSAGLVINKLGSLRCCTVASPRYVSNHGRPASPDDLRGHRMVGLVSSTTGEASPLQFHTGDKLQSVVLPKSVTATSAKTQVEAAIQGFGLVQGLFFEHDDAIRTGRLVEILRKYRPPPHEVSFCYPESRRVSARVMLFQKWVTQRFMNEVVRLAATQRDSDRIDGWAWRNEDEQISKAAVAQPETDLTR